MADMTVGRITFTPGPWRAFMPKGLNSYGIRNAIGADIADVWGADDPVPNGVQKDEVKANARLIAAAPDLLTALKASRLHVAASAEASHLLQGFNRSETAEDLLLQAVDAAIAKAEGRE